MVFSQVHRVGLGEGGWRWEGIRTDDYFVPKAFASMSEGPSI